MDGAGPIDRSARKAEGAFVVCSDANWLWQSAFVLQQAIDSDPQGRLDFFYVTDFDPTGSPLSRLLDPRITVLTLKDDLAEVALTGSDHVPKATFLRLFALERLATRYRKVIYADGDVFLSWGSWADLLDLPDSALPIAAVAGRSVWFNHPRMRYGRRYRQALCAAMGDRYLNSGVLVVNSGPYLAQDMSRRSLAFFRDNPSLCEQGDQSALNAVLAGNWDELSPSWNWQVATHNLPVLARLHPRVIHFTGPIKPWNDRHGFFRPAQDAMCGFLADRDADDLLQTVKAACRPHSNTPRQALFQSRWLGEADTKFWRLRRYLGRTDFADTRAGLPMFSATPSAFGTGPAPVAATMTKDPR